MCLLVSVSVLNLLEAFKNRYQTEAKRKRTEKALNKNNNRKVNSHLEPRVLYKIDKIENHPSSFIKYLKEINIK